MSFTYVMPLSWSTIKPSPACSFQIAAQKAVIQLGLPLRVAFAGVQPGDLNRSIGVDRCSRDAVAQGTRSSGESPETVDALKHR